MIPITVAYASSWPWASARALFPRLPQQLNSLKLFQIVNKMLTCNINNFIFHLCQYKEKSSRGITRSRALHVLHSPRLKRDYLRPDVSLSKEKKKGKEKKTTLSARKQPHLDARSSRASAARRLERLKMQDFRFSKRPPFHVVFSASIILTPAFTRVTD